MKRLRWLVNRLRAMRPEEISFRFRRLLHTQWQSMGFGLAHHVPSPTRVLIEPWINAHTDLSTDPYTNAANRIISGLFDVFALPDINLGFPPKWNVDPKTKIEAPHIFGKRIDYRDEKTVGDIKYLWEPNRHLELVTLAQAWKLTGDPRYADALRIYLISWFDQCPYPIGINWTSSLELGIRLVNWSAAWQIIGGLQSPIFDTSEGQALRDRWLASIYQHCHFIANYLSLHSSANNHLLGECLGLLTAALTWPMWSRSSIWAKQGLGLFEAEALKQNTSDGVNREQAVYYHQAVATMMILAGLAAQANKISYGRDYWNTLSKMLDFMRSLQNRAGHVPMIGDADDAVLIGLNPDRRDANVFITLLSLGSIVLNRPDLAPAEKHPCAEAYWIAGGRMVNILSKRDSEHPIIPVRTSLTKDYPEGGYWILGEGFGEDNEIKIVVDAGSLGYLGIAAHGHADALSFTLSAFGKELLIDSGTFAYHTNPKWRDYFRGTSAHNTVRIDFLDQSVSGGNFIWAKHASARCEKFESNQKQDIWIGSHDGYTRLDDAVIHRREVIYQKGSCAVEVTDVIEAQDAHDIEQFWHFAEDCDVQCKGSLAVILVGDVQLSMNFSTPGLKVECIRGQESPPLGWISRRYDTRLPVTTIRCSGRIESSMNWKARLELSKVNPRGKNLL